MMVAADASDSCVESSSACSLGAAAEWAASQTGMVVRLTLQAGEYTLDAPLRFDASSGAAEVVLSAEAGAEVVLRQSARRRRLQSGGTTTAALLHVSSGSLTLERVQLRDTAAGEHAVLVDGGTLLLRESTFSANLGPSALHVSGGEVTVEDGAFTENAGSAVTVSGGSFVASGSSFSRNGGAALHVTAGSVALGNGTLLHESLANVSAAVMQIDGGSARSNSSPMMRDESRGSTWSEPRVGVGGGRSQGQGRCAGLVSKGERNAERNATLSVAHRRARR